MSGLIFVISGPSGSGKTTLVKELLADRSLKGLLHRSISYTTRPKRSGEGSGKDYSFVSQKAFRALLRNKKILEWTKYLGYYYGTPYRGFERQIKKGRHLALCLDLKGAEKIKRLYPENAVSIFVLPPSLGALNERIRKRCSKTCPREINGRLKLAKREIRRAHRYDYCLINKDLKRALEGLRKIVKKEILRRRER